MTRIYFSLLLSEHDLAQLVIAIVTSGYWIHLFLIIVAWLRLPVCHAGSWRRLESNCGTAQGPCYPAIRWSVPVMKYLSLHRAESRRTDVRTVGHAFTIEAVGWLSLRHPGCGGSLFLLRGSFRRTIFHWPGVHQCCVPLVCARRYLAPRQCRYFTDHRATNNDVWIAIV